jgi:hypothetical protein
MIEPIYTRDSYAPDADRPLDKSELVASAPLMPIGFFGSVTYQFEAGRLSVVRIEETVKPARSRHG